MKSLFCFYSLLRISYVDDFLPLIVMQAKTKNKNNKN